MLFFPEVVSASHLCMIRCRSFSIRVISCNLECLRHKEDLRDSRFFLGIVLAGKMANIPLKNTFAQN